MSVLDALCEAVTEGDSKAVQLLLSSASVDVGVKSEALMLAAERGRVEIVEMLLSAGANVNAHEAFVGTACHAAARRRHADVLRVLLAHRPNLRLTDAVGQTALRTALNLGDDRAIVLLIEGGAPLDDSVLVCEVASAGVDAIEALRGRGVVLSELRGRNDCTPLHFVAIAGDVAAMSLLIRCGVDLDARDALGETCSHSAANWGVADSLRYLIDAGADIERVNEEGFTPLILACADGNANCVVLLLAAGACASVRAADGSTTCHAAAAASECDRDVVLSLLAAGADLDASNELGITPRQMFSHNQFMCDFEPEEIESARRHIARVRLHFVRRRALQVCVGLQSRGLDALVMCEILQHACGPVAPLIRFHQWWAIAAAVKHFQPH